MVCGAVTVRCRGRVSTPRLRGGAGDERARPLRRSPLPRAGQRPGAGRRDVRASGGLWTGCQAIGHAGAPQVGRASSRLAQPPRLQGNPRAEGRRDCRARATGRGRPMGPAPRGSAPSRLVRIGRRPVIDPDGSHETQWADWVRAAEDPRHAADRPESLEGLLVLDCSIANYGGHVLAGFLGELGAEVVKLEPPGGDPGRAWGPADASIGGEGLAYLAEGRNRYYATLNLSSAEGQEIFHQLATRADVVIEGFPPGQMDAWGIGYRQLGPLNPRVIYVALSTHGQFGPRSEGSGPAYDLIDQALSGLVYIPADPEGKYKEQAPGHT